jgi:hypothetical protein
MIAIDVCEPQVLRALEKEDWRILKKPHPIHIGGKYIFADISLQRSTNGKSETIIVLEVKCFTNPDNDLQEFYKAIGQYQFYRQALQIYQSAYPVYLALPDVAYAPLIRQPTVSALFNEVGVKLIIVNLQDERITQWLP